MKTLIMLFLIILGQVIKENYCFSQASCDSIFFEVKVPKVVTKIEDLNIQLIVKSFYKQRVLRIPIIPSYGIEDDLGADIVFKVEEKKDSQFVKLLSPVDYSQVYNDTTCLNLKFNEHRLISYNITDFFHFSKGIYRVKVLFRLSNYNKDIKDISTKWIDFQVPEDFEKPPIPVQ